MKRFIIAMMKHETNTFSPIPNPLESFKKGRNTLCTGEAALQEYAGTRTPIGAYIDLAQSRGAEIKIPVAAEASPSGPVSSHAFETVASMICEAIQNGCDALFLDLHGAMVTEKSDDGEGSLLARIREVAPDLPIAVALDFHTNLSEEMVANSTVIVGYKTYPHVDMYETGEHAGGLLLRTVQGEINPSMVWGCRQILTHMLRQGPEEKPMKDVMQIAKDAETEGSVLAASIFGGFPLADVPYVSLSSVIVFDSKKTEAEALCERILDAAWEQRESFVYHPEPLAESIARAKTLGDFPVLLIDHGDNCGAGGTQDDMTVVGEIIKQGLEEVAVGAICDPQAVDEMIRAGVGARVTVPLGGKTDSPAINHRGHPLEITGFVRTINDGEFTITGPVSTGVRVRLGKTVVLDTGTIQFIVTERRHEPTDLGLFRTVGIEPTRKRYVLLKSRLHYRAGFAPIARHIVECAGLGVASSDYSIFPFRKLKRPIYPLDAI